MSAKTVSAPARTALGDKSDSRRKSDPYYLRAVGKAIEAYQALERSGQPVPLHQMAAQVGLTKSSVFRILHTLEVSGAIRKTDDGRYEIAGEDRARMPAVSVSRIAMAAADVLKDMVRSFGETVGLAVLFDNRIEVVSVVESPHMIRMGNTPGRILPPHASALGKCITAFQPESRREALVRSYGLSRITPGTIVDHSELEREYASIRCEGFARDMEESVLDGNCFAAPVSDGTGEVIAGISMSIPKLRMEQFDLQRMLGELCRSAQVISKGIGR
jgi:DNA-binding IclR family transcriptional regulator